MLLAILIGAVEGTSCRDCVGGRLSDAWKVLLDHSAARYVYGCHCLLHKQMCEDHRGPKSQCARALLKPGKAKRLVEI